MLYFFFEKVGLTFSHVIIVNVGLRHHCTWQRLRFWIGFLIFFVKFGMSSVLNCLFFIFRPCHNIECIDLVIILLKIWSGVHNAIQRIRLRKYSMMFPRKKRVKFCFQTLINSTIFETTVLCFLYDDLFVFFCRDLFEGTLWTWVLSCGIQCLSLAERFPARNIGQNFSGIRVLTVVKISHRNRY